MTDKDVEYNGACAENKCHTEYVPTTHMNGRASSDNSLWSGEKQSGRIILYIVVTMLHSCSSQGFVSPYTWLADVHYYHWSLEGPIHDSGIIHVRENGTPHSIRHYSGPGMTN